MRTTPARLSLCAIALAVLAAGCPRPAAYWRSRWLDFADCFTVEAGVGLGIDVEAHVTDYVATGLGVSASWKWGAIGRHSINHARGDGKDFHAGFPALPTYLVLGENLIKDDRRLRDYLPGYLYFDYSWRNVDPSWPIFYKAPKYLGPQRETASLLFLNALALRREDVRSPKGGRLDPFEIDLGATLIPVSIRLGLNPAQFLDFLLGWTMLDIGGDDGKGQRPPPPTPLPPQKEMGPRS